MDAAPAASHEQVSNADGPQRPIDSARLVAAIALVVLLVVSSIWLAVGIVDRKPFDDDEGSSAQDNREAALAQATEFATLYLNYDKSDLDKEKRLTGYVERIQPLMTREGGAEFEKSADALAQLISEFGFSRTAEVKRAGAVSLDDDSAEVVVAGLLSGTQQGDKVPTDTFELTLTLAKVDGEWLVSDIPGAEEELP